MTAVIQFGLKERFQCNETFKRPWKLYVKKCTALANVWCWRGCWTNVTTKVLRCCGQGSNLGSAATHWTQDTEHCALTQDSEQWAQDTGNW